MVGGDWRGRSMAQDGKGQGRNCKDTQGDAAERHGEDVGAAEKQCVQMPGR